MSANLRTTLVPDLSAYVTAESALPHPRLRVEPRWFVQPELKSSALFSKRCFDVIVASFALSIFALPMAILALLIKLTSKGPIFYGQERIGLAGRRFKMWKFRSMRVGAEEGSGAVWTVEKDPRRTQLGCFLRATSLDELPQLWNVLRGEMSMVGPRPERPQFVSKFQNEIPHYLKRHSVPVGITGWAQVSGWRGNTSLERRVEYDLYYIRNWSLWMDLWILVLTPFRGFIHRNAY